METSADALSLRTKMKQYIGAVPTQTFPYYIIFFRCFLFVCLILFVIVAAAAAAEQ